MRRTKVYLGLPPFFAVLLVATPAVATDFCIVQKSADGYVTLRQGPSAQHPEVAKMKPQ